MNRSHCLPATQHNSCGVGARQWRAVAAYRAPDKLGLIELGGGAIVPKPNRPLAGTSPNAAGEERR
jgi:hypothetical protein